MRFHLLIIGFFILCCPVCALSQPLHELIDETIHSAFEGPASPLADDAEFLRRVYLDLSGQIPASTQAREFLADKDLKKRGKLIDRLLAGEEYPRRMQHWMSVMLLERRADAKVPAEQWEQYLRQSFAENKPWDQLVRELIFTESEKESLQPAEKFFLVAGRNDLHQRTQDVARLFLGRDIMCSQCHDHPTVPDYTQTDYFGLYTYLQETPDKARTEFESVFESTKNTTGPRLPGTDELEIPVIKDAQSDEAKQYRPRFLLSKNLPQPGNSNFTRNSVNRLWCFMMGRGLVDPLDMHHQNNPPSHPELLDSLSVAFSESGFDVKHFLRELALSETYQRSSQLPNETKEPDVPASSYRTAIVKPLSPEQMAISVVQATGHQGLLSAKTPGDPVFTYKDYLNGRLKDGPKNLPDALKLFVGVFGNPPGEPEVTFSPAVGHSLFIMNEPLILDWLKPREGNLIHRLAQLNDETVIAEELYLSVLTRLPCQEERTEVAGYLAKSEDRREKALGELAWALIASAEFRLNH